GFHYGYSSVDSRRGFLQNPQDHFFADSNAGAGIPHAELPTKCENSGEAGPGCRYRIQGAGHDHYECYGLPPGEGPVFRSQRREGGRYATAVVVAPRINRFTYPVAGTLGCLSPLSRRRVVQASQQMAAQRVATLIIVGRLRATSADCTRPGEPP